WSELPNLRELVLDGRIILQFDTLPLDHPLERLCVQQWNAEVISSWINSNNLRQVTILGGLWKKDGFGGGRGTASISNPDMNRLLEKAERRGHWPAPWILLLEFPVSIFLEDVIATIMIFSLPHSIVPS
ncbi:17078_t:CDS:2, partial [Acaulospora colombiana]